MIVLGFVRAGFVFLFLWVDWYLGFMSRVLRCEFQIWRVFGKRRRVVLY